MKKTVIFFSLVAFFRSWGCSDEIPLPRICNPRKLIIRICNPLTIVPY